MLDDYKETQEISYKILLNSIKNKRESHAYLIETNGYGKSLDFAISFAKYLLCPNNKSNNKNCKNCTQCQKIDNGNFTEIKIIEADGIWIKKEQLLDLKEEFSKKSLNASKKIYIINNAEKLNSSSENSLLKFLEEPEDNIIAILLTNNKYQLLDTVISRCQTITLSNNISYKNKVENIANILYNDKTKIEEYVSDEKNIEKINNVINFVRYYEDNGFTNTYVNFDNLLKQYNYNKNEIFEIIINFYKDILNYKLKRKIEIFSDNEKYIKNISEKNQISTIVDKMIIYMEIKKDIEYNANNNLLLDKLLIRLGEIK